MRVSISFRHKGLRALAGILLAAFISACAPDTSTIGTAPRLAPQEPIPIALLVPTSSQNAAEIAGSLEQAARMAVSDLEPVKIDLRVYDTAGRSGSVFFAGQLNFGDMIAAMRIRQKAFRACGCPFHWAA